MNVSLLAVLAKVPPEVSVKVSVHPLWKFAPLIVRFWLALDAGTGLGNTPLIVGAGRAAACTVKLNQLEDLPSGLMTLTFQVPASLKLLNWYVSLLLELNVSLLDWLGYSMLSVSLKMSVQPF